ncbi:MAG: hypothetical protein KBT45_04080 [Bacteroidales bacterium]|nr:hypothetical protein [Candidatus Colimorpha pelethequi]
MFFPPRIGSYYQDGFQGYRTLVLGAHHVCLKECEFKHLCCTPEGVKTMDYKCPCYEQFAGVLCLHDSNNIEIEAFCDDEAGYPTYSTFTKFLLGRKAPLTIEEKIDFWDHLAFANLLQCFVPQKVTPSYAECPELYDQAIPDFVQILDQLKPQVVYVWEQITYNAIMANKDRLPGLRQEPLFPEHPTLQLYKFSYETELPTMTVAKIGEILHSVFSKIALAKTPDAYRQNVVKPERAIYNALRYGLLDYLEGRFVLNSNFPEKESGCFLATMLVCYQFDGWSDMDKLFVKYNKSGEPINLRKIRRFKPDSVDDRDREAHFKQAIFKAH